MIRVLYSGSARGLPTLVGELSAAGLDVQFDPPADGAEENLVQEVIRVASDAEAALVGETALEAVRRITGAFSVRDRDATAYVEPTDQDAP